jgi:hypothetical protein
MSKEEQEGFLEVGNPKQPMVQSTHETRATLQSGIHGAIDPSINHDSPAQYEGKGVTQSLFVQPTHEPISGQNKEHDFDER